MKLSWWAVGVALVLSNARADVWQPEAGHTQIPLWPGAIPDAQPVAGPEEVKVTPNERIAGKPITLVSHVTQPTMTVYSPKGKNTGAAVVVFPGGGYEILAIDLEGTEICDWLTAQGITAVLLKYRVPGDGGYPRPAKYRKSGGYPRSPIALEDAQRCLGLVRLHAAEWGIDRHKIGVIGFSAGGDMVMQTSTRFSQRIYPLVDAADRESCRPDFAIAVYPGHLWDEGKPLTIVPTVQVPADAPTTFLLQAENDPVDDVQNSLVYYYALKTAKIPVEMHLYAEGGHAFGLRRTDKPITAWPQLVETWLRTIRVLAPTR